MEYSYETENTCCKLIKFKLNGNVVTDVVFLGGGCPGNLQALPRLVDGMTIEQIETKIGDIICGRRGTSCAGELVKGLKIASKKEKQIV